MSVALPVVVGVGVPEVGDVVVHRHRVEQHPGGQPRLHLLLRLGHLSPGPCQLVQAGDALLQQLLPNLGTQVLVN